MSADRPRALSAKRQRLAELATGQKRQDLLDLVSYMKDCSYDAAYAAELLRDVLECVCDRHRLVGAVRSADKAAAFGRAGGTLDLSGASARGAEQAIFAAAGAEVLQK